MNGMNDAEKYTGKVFDASLFGIGCESLFVKVVDCEDFEQEAMMSRSVFSGKNLTLYLDNMLSPSRAIHYFIESIKESLNLMVYQKCTKIIVLCLY